MPTSEYPALRYMFSIYFNEDFDEDGGDWPEVVDLFAERNPHKPTETIAELEGLLESDLDDQSLREIVRTCGSVYFIEPGTAREFLRGIRDRLASQASPNTST